MQANHGITRILAALGAIPFIACAFLPYLGFNELPYLGDTGNIAAAYGLTIASFMAGVHWGTALNAEVNLPVNLFITSNVVAVAAWLSFLLVSLSQALALLAILFAYLLYIDFRLHRAGLIGQAYWNTRLSITGIVIVCLTIIARGG